MRVWDVNHDGAPISRLPDHENKVTKVAHAGSCFYSTSRNVLRIWDSATSSCIEKIAFKGDGDIRDLVSGRHATCACVLCPCVPQPGSPLLCGTEHAPPPFK